MTYLLRLRNKATQRGANRAMAFQSVIAVVLLSLLSFVSVMNTSFAHPILVPRPTQTLTDRLLQTDSVVLAREDPQRPFHYAAVKTLKGDSDVTSIDLFMTTQVRRRLSLDPELTVLIRRNPNNQEWEALGVANDEYEQVVLRILTFDNVWTPNETDNPERLHEFASLLGHQDIRLHELAYLEIGRASYTSIREVGADVPLGKVRAMLVDPLYFEWRGLDIMLLGLSDDELDQVRVVNEMQQRQSQSISLNLAAWTTAYLEVEGTEGLDQVVEWYLRNESRSRDELRSVTRALSGHANYDPKWRQPVVEAYREMLKTHPNLAPDIAHDLIAWQQWDFSEQLRQLLPELKKTDPLGVQKVNLYLQRAMMKGRMKPH